MLFSTLLISAHNSTLSKKKPTQMSRFFVTIYSYPNKNAGYKKTGEQVSGLISNIEYQFNKLKFVLKAELSLPNRLI